MHHRHEEKPDLPLRVAAHAVVSLGRIQQVMLAKGGTPGKRHLASPATLLSLIALAWLALLGGSDLLWVILALAAMSLLVHKAKAVPGQHSRFLGTSAFQRFTGENVVAGWLLAHLFTLGAGAALLEVEPAAGWWLVASGVSNLVLLAFLSVKEGAVRRDLKDAIAEGQYRSRIL